MSSNISPVFSALPLAASTEAPPSLNLGQITDVVNAVSKASAILPTPRKENIPGPFYKCRSAHEEKVFASFCRRMGAPSPKPEATPP